MHFEVGSKKKIYMKKIRDEKWDYNSIQGSYLI